jgi:hypothetical protein
MRINNYQFPKSSFLSLEKDLNIIIGEMMKNKRFQRLLYYTTKDALDKPDITEDQMYELFGKNIKTVPKLYIDGSVLNYIIISFDNFTPNATNPEFRDNIISFDIICHFDQWQLNETTELRPYKIAAEIDAMFDNKHLSGIGTLQFLGANQLFLNEEFAGLSIMYSAIHGEEDKKGMPNPADDEKYAIEFDNLFNN